MTSTWPKQRTGLTVVGALDCSPKVSSWKATRAKAAPAKPSTTRPTYPAGSSRPNCRCRNTAANRSLSFRRARPPPNGSPTCTCGTPAPGPAARPPSASTKLISNEKPANAAESERGNRYSVDGATAGCKRVIFESEYRFLGAPAGSLYEWVEGPGREGRARCASRRLGERENATTKRTDTRAVGLRSSDGRKTIRSERADERSHGHRRRNLPRRLHRDGRSGHRTKDTKRSSCVKPGQRPGPSRTETASTIEVSASQGSSPEDTARDSRPPRATARQIFFTANYGLTNETSAGSRSASELRSEPRADGSGLRSVRIRREHWLSDRSLGG